MCCTPKWSVLYNVLWELYFHFVGPEQYPYQVTVLSCLIALLKIELKLNCRMGHADHVQRNTQVVKCPKYFEMVLCIPVT